MVFISVTLKSYIEQQHISFASQQFKTNYMIVCQRMIISYHNSIYVQTYIFHDHTAQNMKLLQELVHYKSLKIEKNCKEEIIRFISLLCLFQCLNVQQIITCFNFV